MDHLDGVRESSERERKHKNREWHSKTLQYTGTGLDNRSKSERLITQNIQRRYLQISQLRRKYLSKPNPLCQRRIYKAATGYSLKAEVVRESG